MSAKSSSSIKVPLPREIWILTAAGFIIALGYGLIAPILPQFIRTFDVSMAAAGAVVSVFSLTRLVFATTAGRAVDKIGPRKIYLTGLMVVAVTTGLVTLTAAYWQVVALRALAGVGSTMFTVSAMGLIVKISPTGARGRATALYASGFLLGNVIGPVMGAGLSFLGFRWPFAIYGVGVSVAAWVVSTLMPRADARTSDPKAAPKPLMSMNQAWHNSSYRAALTSNFAHGWINMGVRVTTLPLFAASIFAHGGAIAGFAMAVYAAGNAIVLQFSGKLSDMYGRRPLILIGLVGAAVFSGGMGFADNKVLLLVFSLLAGGFAGLLNPSQQAAEADIIGNERSAGRVLSTYQMAMDAGQILGPILVGALADHLGFTVAFGTCAVVAVAAIVVWLRAEETMGR